MMLWKAKNRNHFETQMYIGATLFVTLSFIGYLLVDTLSDQRISSTDIGGILIIPILLLLLCLYVKSFFFSIKIDNGVLTTKSLLKNEIPIEELTTISLGLSPAFHVNSVVFSTKTSSYYFPAVSLDLDHWSRVFHELIQMNPSIEISALVQEELGKEAEDFVSKMKLLLILSTIALVFSFGLIWLLESLDLEE
ncbi:MAG TPA: hypothetical protein VE710_13820 [Candidatus Bathyarchaeia archaeon]|nr:hypothetical protein [Candidatus Bathyarchaeia archaeon]